VRPLPLALYRIAASAGGWPIRQFLRRRLRLGKEDPVRLAERMGKAGVPRPPGPLVWVHGASVGESLSALPLIEALRRARPAVDVLVTTGTVTSAAMLAERLPRGVLHQYVPVDRPPWARAFLAHWKPDTVLWIESDLWPNLLGEVAARRIPAVLINARMSERSFRRWRFLARGSVRRLLGTFSHCLAQSEPDGERFRRLGARGVACLGNLKAAAPPLPIDEVALGALRRDWGERPRWLAASTHDGEEMLCARLHRSLAATHPELLTVIVPRHADRGVVIAAALRAEGFRVAQRSLDERVDAETEIYLADTMGELGLFYRACPVALIGKSLIGRGGQNPVEPARLGCAVLYGPHMDNFPEVAPALEEAGGAIRVADEAALGAELRRLLSDPATCSGIGRNGLRYAENQAGAVERMLEVILPQIPDGAV
jgi:3-deoxy-D-manno-octulosonic-acid transferase